MSPVGPSNWIGAAVLLVVSFFLSNACSMVRTASPQSAPQAPPVLTGGAIVVSRPELFTHSRLINQRQRDIELLERRLTDFEGQGFQGLRDVRVIRIGPDQFEKSESVGKTAVPEPQIPTGKQGPQVAVENLPVEQRGELEPLPLAGESQSRTSSGEPAPTPQKQGAQAGRILEPASPEDFVITRAELSPIEKVRDEMDYRRMLQAELKSNLRDEQIMSMGFTEYGLNFDVTIVPGMNTRSLGEATLILRAQDTVSLETFHRWRRHLQRDLEFAAFSLQRRWRAGSLTDKEKISLQEEAWMLRQRIRRIIERDQNQIEELKFLQKQKETRLRDAGEAIPELEKQIEIIDRQLAELPRERANRNVIGNLESEKSQAQKQIVERQSSIDSMQKELLENRADQDRLRDQMAKYRRRIESIDGFVADFALEQHRPGEANQWILCDILRERFLTKLEDLVVFLPHNRVAIGDAGGCIPQIDQNPPPETEALQFDNFRQKLADLDLQPYVASVHPKQYVQLISDTTARKIKADLGSSNAAITIFQGISRRPLAVGYKRGLNEFGWVMGPRLEVDPDGNVSERHLPGQYSFMVNIVVPAWLESIRLEGRYYWLNADGSLGKGSNIWEGEMQVPLPGDPNRITSALLKHVALTDPVILPPGRTADGENRFVVREGRKATLMIRGHELWRHPAAFLGTQQASSIDVLPDLNGLVIRFDKIQISPQSKKAAGNPLLDLRVVTMQGEAVLPNAVEVLPEIPPGR